MLLSINLYARNACLSSAVVLQPTQVCMCGCVRVCVWVGGWVPRDKQKHKFAPQAKVATVTAALSPVSNASGHLEDQET